jgi:hypothetical protein
MVVRTPKSKREQLSDGELFANSVARIADFWNWRTMGSARSWAFRRRPSRAYATANGASSRAPSRSSLPNTSPAVPLPRFDDGKRRPGVAFLALVPNVEPGSPPIELTRTIGGLVTVADYVDAYRARV